MQLPDLKELDRVLALCRKRGVQKFRIGELELTLSDEVPQSNYKRQQQEAVSQVEEDYKELTPEELLMWSALPAGPVTNEGN